MVELTSLSNIFSSTFQEKHWPLLKEMKDKVVAECFDGGISEEDKEKFRQKVRCILDAVTEAVKGTDFAPVWAKYAKHLVDQHQRVKACTDKSTTVEIGRLVSFHRSEIFHFKFTKLFLFARHSLLMCD